jgi:hypothetical protein
MDEGQWDDSPTLFSLHPSHMPAMISALYISTQLILATVYFKVKELLLLFPFFRWENWGAERLSNLPNTIQLINCPSWDWNPGSLVPEPILLTTNLYWLFYWG